MIGNITNDKTLAPFTKGKSALSLLLFQHFTEEYNKIGDVILYPTKTMIGIAAKDRRIAWVTQLGKNSIHVVFPFQKAYEDNLCFQKIAQVPGDAKQFNHHFRMYYKEDINEEVLEFMKLAYKGT
jgi:hypothetical protein